MGEVAPATSEINIDTVEKDLTNRVQQILAGFSRDRPIQGPERENVGLDSEKTQDLHSILDVPVQQHQYTPRKLLNEFTRPGRQFVLVLEKPENYVRSWSKTEVYKEISSTVSRWKQEDRYGPSYRRYLNHSRIRTPTLQSRETTPVSVSFLVSPESFSGAFGDSSFNPEPSPEPVPIRQDNSEDRSEVLGDHIISTNIKEGREKQTEKQIDIPDIPAIVTSPSLASPEVGKSKHIDTNIEANMDIKPASHSQNPPLIANSMAEPVEKTDGSDIDEWGAFESPVPSPAVATFEPLKLEPLKPELLESSNSSADILSQSHAPLSTVSKEPSVVNVPKEPSVQTTSSQSILANIGPYSTPTSQIKRQEDATVDEVVSKLPDLSFMLG